MPSPAGVVPDRLHPGEMQLARRVADALRGAVAEALQHHEFPDVGSEAGRLPATASVHAGVEEDVEDQRGHEDVEED